MNITVQRLKEQHAEAFRNLRLEGLKAYPSAFMSSYEEESLQTLAEIQQSFRQRWNSDTNLLFGAFSGEELAGVVGLYQDSFLKRRHKMIIWGMYVRENFQHKGLGRLLMTAALVHARTLPEISRIELTVESGNQSAKRLYQSMGFVTWGTEPDAMKTNGIFYHDECMSLRLK